MRRIMAQEDADDAEDDADAGDADDDADADDADAEDDEQDDEEEKQGLDLGLYHDDETGDNIYIMMQCLSVCF